MKVDFVTSTLSRRRASTLLSIFRDRIRSTADKYSLRVCTPADHPGRRAIICLDINFHLILESFNIVERDRAIFRFIHIFHGDHFVWVPLVD